MGQTKSAGYRFLTDKYKMRHIPHWRSSFVSGAKRGRHSVTEDNVREEFYPARNWPGERACDHLEFASIETRPGHPLRLSISNPRLRELRNSFHCSRLLKQRISARDPDFLVCKT